MSADAKDAGKSPPKPATGGTSPGIAPAPAGRPAPPLPAGVAKPKPLPPIAPPKPAGAPPPAIGKPLAPPPPAAGRPLAPPPPAARPVGPAGPVPSAAPRPPAAKPPAPAAPPIARPVPAVPAAAVAPPPEPPPAAPVPSEVPPPLEIPADIAAIAAQLDARPPRTTMDFLFELDSPVPSSAEIDLRGVPDVQAAIAGADPDAAGSLSVPPEPELPVLPRDSFHPAPIESIEPPPLSPRELSATGDAVPRSVARVSLKPIALPSTADEQHELRKRRLITRIVTCRDAFRVLGFLDIKESDRSEIARLMMALDPALDPTGNTDGVAKEPAALLASASKDQIDRVERLLSPIEDKLLAIDDIITDQALATRVEGGKITAKTLARYGRLLVSRRLQAGPRRDRFEWIATALLTRKNPDGTRTLVNADRATRVLELLIGGLLFKPKDEELEEAVQFLNDALERLRGFKSHEEFFQSEYFIDVHGYKVTMRELLLSPDFVYLSVAINAGLHNRVEEWVAEMERAHKPNQLMQDGSPREHLARRLRDQEAAVADIFGVKPRTVPTPSSVRPPPSASPTADKRKARETSKPHDAAKLREAAKPREATKPKKGSTSGKPAAPAQTSAGGRVLMFLLTIIMIAGLLYAGYRFGVIDLEQLRKLGVPGLPQPK